MPVTSTGLPMYWVPASPALCSSVVRMGRTPQAYRLRATRVGWAEHRAAQQPPTTQTNHSTEHPNKPGCIKCCATRVGWAEHSEAQQSTNAKSQTCSRSTNNLGRIKCWASLRQPNLRVPNLSLLHRAQGYLRRPREKCQQEKNCGGPG